PSSRTRPAPPPRPLCPSAPPSALPVLLLSTFCSLPPFRAFDNLGEAVEPLQPRADALEGIRHQRAPADAADLLRRYEFRFLEQPDVLLHPCQRHPERLGELADARAACAEPFEDGAAGRVGQGCEGAVGGRGILNHWVHYN